MSAPSRPPQEASAGAPQTSIGDLLSELGQDVSRLVRQEANLAKAELRQEAKKTGKVGGLFGGTAFAGYMTLLFASIAGWWGLANVMDRSWAALIIAGIWAVIGTILFAAGRVQGHKITGLRQTAETVREAPGALKPSPDHKEGQS